MSKMAFLPFLLMIRFFQSPEMSFWVATSHPFFFRTFQSKDLKPPTVKRRHAVQWAPRTSKTTGRPNRTMMLSSHLGDRRQNVMQFEGKLCRLLGWCMLKDWESMILSHTSYPLGLMWWFWWKSQGVKGRRMVVEVWENTGHCSIFWKNRSSIFIWPFSWSVYLSLWFLPFQPITWSHFFYCMFVFSWFFDDVTKNGQNPCITQWNHLLRRVVASKEHQVPGGVDLAKVHWNLTPQMVEIFWELHHLRSQILLNIWRLMLQI